MERSEHSQCPELLASILEYGDKMQRRSVFHKMIDDTRMCEAVVMALRAMALFNQKHERYEIKK